jgi:hypothetical protein
MEQHRQVTPWAWAVTLVESSLYDSGREALVAEAAEIRRLRPRWNLTERGPRSDWQLSDYVEVILATAEKRLRTTGIKAARADAHIARLKRELVWRFPDTGPVVLADIDPHTQQMGAVA